MYRGCSGMEKQEFVHTSLQDLDIVWSGENLFGVGIKKLRDSWKKTSEEIIS